MRPTVAPLLPEGAHPIASDQDGLPRIHDCPTAMPTAARTRYMTCSGAGMTPGPDTRRPGHHTNLRFRQYQVRQRICRTDSLL